MKVETLSNESLENQVKHMMATLGMNLLHLKVEESSEFPDEWRHRLLARAIVRDKRRYHPFYNFRYYVEVRALHYDDEKREYLNLPLKSVRDYIRHTEERMNNDAAKVDAARPNRQVILEKISKHQTIVGDPLEGDSIYFCFPEESQGKVYLFEHICTTRHTKKCEYVNLDYHG